MHERVVACLSFEVFGFVVARGDAKYSLCLSDAAANRIGGAGDNEFGKLHGVDDGEGAAPRDTLGESDFVAAEYDRRKLLGNFENLWITPRSQLQNLQSNEGSAKDPNVINIMKLLMITALF
jgi:hypothetical protein